MSVTFSSVVAYCITILIIRDTYLISSFNKYGFKTMYFNVQNCTARMDTIIVIKEECSNIWIQHLL